MEDYSDLDALSRPSIVGTPTTSPNTLTNPRRGRLRRLAGRQHLVQSNDTYHKKYYLHNRMEDDKWSMPWDYDLTWGRN
jgi:hypothetical protein